MSNILTTEMQNTIKTLGEHVKADPRCKAIEETIADYERSEELNALIAEYNGQQGALAESAAKGEADQETIMVLQARIDELYKAITTHPVYLAYVDAKQAFDALSAEIYAELQYVITGQRPCSHNCSSCHSDCGSGECGCGDDCDCH